MSKIGIMTDVNAGLDYVSTNYDCKVLRSIINFGDEHYIDGLEIRAEEFYERLQSNSNVIPSTSAPTVGEAMEAIEDYIKNGYTDIIMFPISYKLSSIGQMVENLQAEYEGQIKIHVFDTKTAAYLQGYYVVKACEMVEKGCSVEEILDYANYLRSNTHAFFVVDDLKYLVKNGRLSATSGALGSLLKIKPILHIDTEGRIVPYEKVRTRSKAILRAEELLLNEVKDAKKIKLILFHTCCEDLGKQVENELKEKISCEVDSELHMITPAVGAHIGCGVVGMCYYILEK